MSTTFNIGHLDLFIIAESSLPPPRFVHLVLQAAVHHTKLQLKTEAIPLAFMC